MRIHLSSGRQGQRMKSSFQPVSSFRVHVISSRLHRVTNRSLEIMAELGVRIDLFADTPFVDHGIAFHCNPNEGHDIMPAELDQTITWLQAATSHDE